MAYIELRLPDADQAIIDDRKLTGYALNPEHEEGKHKAFVFTESVFPLNFGGPAPVERRRS